MKHGFDAKKHQARTDLVKKIKSEGPAKGLAGLTQRVADLEELLGVRA